VNAEASQEKMRRAVRVLTGLALASLAVSVILFIATLYTWKAIFQVREIERKMEEIGLFEKRIDNKLDLFNAGIQSLIDKTNSRISNIHAQINKSVSHNHDTLIGLDAAAAQLGMRFNSDFPAGTFYRNYANQPAPREVRRSVPGRSQIAGDTGAPLATGLPRYRRIMALDGSVRYEKVR